MRKSSCVLAAAMLLGGCGTAITVIPLKSQKGLASRSPESVEVFTAGRPSRPFAELAVLVGQQRSSWGSDDQAAVLQKLRAKAAELGCDGLVVTGQNNATSGTDKVVWTLQGFQATCIVFEP